MTDRLEIVGPASAWLLERVLSFCEALDGSVWGSVPPARLVVAEDFVAALRRYLPHERFVEWERRQRDRGEHALGVGMGFVAADGTPTAVAVAIPESTGRAELLHLCCHELCELSIDATGGEDRSTMNAAMSGVIWSEHVVERRRAHVFTAHGWPPSALDQSGLGQQLADYQTEFPQLIRWAVQNNAVPDRIYGHWQIITRDVVCAYGRAQGGVEAEERGLQSFVDAQSDAFKAAWLDLMILCDRAFEEGPGLSVAERDALGEEGWHGVYAAFQEQWNAAYFAAQR